MSMHMTFESKLIAANEHERKMPLTKSHEAQLEQQNKLHYCTETRKVT